MMLRVKISNGLTLFCWLAFHSSMLTVYFAVTGDIWWPITASSQSPYLSGQSVFWTDGHGRFLTNRISPYITHCRYYNYTVFCKEVCTTLVGYILKLCPLCLLLSNLQFSVRSWSNNLKTIWTQPTLLQKQQDAIWFVYRKIYCSI